MTLFKLMLPPHKCSLTITHNQHKDYYEGISDYILGHGGCLRWESEDAQKESIRSNEIWEMQWYPDTPIGFYRIAAPTLDALLEFSKTIK